MSSSYAAVLRAQEQNGPVTGLVHCTTTQDCQKYGKTDIYNELSRRGVILRGNETKPELIKRLLNSNREMQLSYRQQLKGPQGKRLTGTFPSLQSNPAMYYLTPKDFGLKTSAYNAVSQRIAKAIQDNIGKGESISDIITQVSTIKPVDDISELPDNFDELKEEDKVVFMWNIVSKRMGLLKEQFLTIDHVGLKMKNSNGDIFRVTYDPFADQGEWIPVAGAKWSDIPVEMRLDINIDGPFRLDKNGVPLISDLTYDRHHAKAWQIPATGRVIQVHCVKKSPKSHDESPDNCMKTKNGEPKLRWGPFDPLMTKRDVYSGKKFTTPLGVMTYSELMKLPLDKVVQMLVLLKIMEKSSDYDTTLANAGITFDPVTGKMVTGNDVPIINELNGNAKIYPRSKTVLPKWFTDAENRSYEALGLKKCYGRKPNRCSVDSYAPGTCVPDAELCYDPEVAKFYATPYDDANGTGRQQQNIRKAVGKIGEDFKKVVEGLTDSSSLQIQDNRYMQFLPKKYGVDRFGRLQPLVKGPTISTNLKNELEAVKGLSTPATEGTDGYIDYDQQYANFTGLTRNTKLLKSTEKEEKGVTRYSPLA